VPAGGAGRPFVRDLSSRLERQPAVQAQRAIWRNRCLEEISAPSASLRRGSPTPGHEVSSPTPCWVGGTKWRAACSPVKRRTLVTDGVQGLASRRRAVRKSIWRRKLVRTDEQCLRHHSRLLESQPTRKPTKTDRPSGCAVPWDVLLLAEMTGIAFRNFRDELDAVGVSAHLSGVADRRYPHGVAVLVRHGLTLGGAEPILGGYPSDDLAPREERSLTVLFAERRYRSDWRAGMHPTLQRRHGSERDSASNGLTSTCPSGWWGRRNRLCSALMETPGTSRKPG